MSNVTPMQSGAALHSRERALPEPEYLQHKPHGNQRRGHLSVRKPLITQKERWEELVKRVNKRLEKDGVCTLPNDELSILWNYQEGIPDEGKEVQILNFCYSHGLTPQISKDFKMTVFQRKPGPFARWL